MTQGLDNKITLIIEGGAVTDEQSEQLYQIAYDCVRVGMPFTFTCSSENFFNRLRVGIAEGQLNHSLVVFVYQGVKFHANKYGAVHDWPRDMLEYSIQMCERIIEGAYAQHKNDKEQRSMA